MSNLFYKGDFNKYKINDSELRKSLTESVNFSAEGLDNLGQITVFISHKHDDLEDLRGLIGFLQKEYNVKTYIDSNDEKMPKITSGETAERIKEKIRTCKKFILLATNTAIESKWCNWELGFGDVLKSENNDIAILPMNERCSSDSSYAGNEYMEIYPTIVYRDGVTKYKNLEKIISKGLYVRTKNKNNDGYSIESLEKWLGFSEKKNLSAGVDYFGY